MRVVVLLGAVGLAFTACATRGDADGSQPDSVEETSVPDQTTSSTSTSTHSDLELARGAVLGAEDLPAGWVECCPPETPDEDQLRDHICGSPDGLAPRTAAYVRQYSLNLRPDGNEDGHLLAAVYVSPTEPAAIEEFTGVDAPGYESCMIEGVAETAATYRPDRTAEPSVTFERALLPMDDVSASLDRFVSEVPVEAQVAKMYTAILRIRVDRVLVRLEINTFAAPVPSELLADIGATSVELAHQSLDDT